MDTAVWIAVAAAAVLVLVTVVWIFARRRRSRHLREQFGHEYDRTIEESDGKRQAELDLRDRTRQREQLEIRPLTQPARDRYIEDWRAVQLRFVDRPLQVVADADALLTSIMRERGYPVDDFDTRADLMSVDHPAAVANYRRAHQVYERTRGNEASTDDLRDAVICYRSVFEELLVTSNQQDDREDATSEERVTRQAG